MHGPPTHATLRSWQGPWKTDGPKNFSLPRIQAGTWGVKEPREWLGWGSSRPSAGNRFSTFKATGSSTIAFSHVMPNTVGLTAKSTSLCERVRTVVLSEMAPVTSPRNPGFHYPAPDRPFYRRATSSAKYSNVLRLSLKTDKLASLGPFFVDRSAIPCEGVVGNFLFWQECSKGLLCCLCRELGWTSEWVCPDFPLVVSLVAPTFSSLKSGFKWSIHLMCESRWLPALQKHDGYQYILPAGVRELHRTASSPTHVEWGSVFSMAEGTGNSSPSASSPTHLDWFLTTWYLGSKNRFVRIAWFSISFFTRTCTTANFLSSVSSLPSEGYLGNVEQEANGSFDATV